MLYCGPVLDSAVFVQWRKPYQRPCLTPSVTENRTTPVIKGIFSLFFVHETFIYFTRVDQRFFFSDNGFSPLEAAYQAPNQTSAIKLSVQALLQTMQSHLNTWMFTVSKFASLSFLHLKATFLSPSCFLLMFCSSRGVPFAIDT